MNTLKKIDWTVVAWFSMFHIGSVFAPFFFTWKALLVCLIGVVATGLGVTVGFHRLLTHASFKTYRPVKWFWGWLGGLAGEGTGLHWVAVHRLHHEQSDQEGDPHSPRHGGIWSHILWMLIKRPKLKELYERYIPDLLQDSVMMFLHRTFLLWHILLAGALFGIGCLWDLETGLSFLFWGVFVRMLVVLHVTWFVNSATHLWGYRNYETTDDSKNLWWVGLLAFGEGWHNNHHKFPWLARHGHKLWEIDVSYWVIRAMQFVGLAWDVKSKIPAT